MNAAERSTIAAHAYVPEHLIAYVAAITGGRPHLIGDCVAYTCDDRLIFVGYPLSGPPGSAGAGRLRNGSSDFQSPDAPTHASPQPAGAGRLRNGSSDFQSPDAPSPDAPAAWQPALDTALTRFRPRLVSVTAPSLPASLNDCAASSPDAYYRLHLAAVQPDKKLRNLLGRAGREVTVREGRFGPEHERLVAEFLAATPVDAGTRYIFGRLGRYAGRKSRIMSGIEASAGFLHGALDRLKPRFQGRSVEDAQTGGAGRPLILEARDAAGRLVAFDIAAFGGEVAFYLFNFRSRQCYVPGTSDLLLARLIAEGQARGQRYLNLGLGINRGVSRFKEKWGAEPFLPHVSCAWERPVSAWEDALGGR